MTYCPHNNKEIRVEWIDRRLPFLRSLREDAFCLSCADELEADEFVEITNVSAILPPAKAVVDEILGFSLTGGK